MVKKTKKTKRQTEEEKRANLKKAFIEHYLEYGDVGATCAAIGVKSRRTFYNWCDSDPAFKEIYETELLPDRRGQCVSLLYRAATGRLGTHTRTWTDKRGNEYTEEVAIELSETQRSALFGFLKATDHNDRTDAPDRMIFAERHQISGPDGAPVAIIKEVEIRLNDTGSRS